MSKQKTPITDKNGKQTHVWKRIGDALNPNRKIPAEAPAKAYQVEVRELRYNDLVLEGGKAFVVSIVPSKAFSSKVSINLSDGRSILAGEDETISIIPAETAPKYNTYADVDRATSYFHSINQAERNGGGLEAYAAIDSMAKEDVVNALVVGSEFMDSETSKLIVDGDDVEVALGEFIENVNVKANWDGIDGARELVGQYTDEQRRFFLFDIATSRKLWSRGDASNG